jgi:membrane protease YdiL (CAAX protease family)
LVVPIAGIWFGILTFIVLSTVSFMWSILYQKYNSLSAPYIIHVLADIALFIIGFDALFIK